MPRASGTSRTRQIAIASDYRLDPDLLDAVLAGLASPSLGTTPGRRHPRRRRVVEAIIALRPTDGVQAKLVAQILGARLLAEEMTGLSTPAAPTETQADIQRCAKARLLRMADRAERALRKAQQLSATSDGTSSGRFDLLTKIAIWRSDFIHHEPAGGWNAAPAAVAPYTKVQRRRDAARAGAKPVSSTADAIL
jgi:hypothetical protein